MATHDPMYDRTGPDPDSRNTYSLATARLRIELPDPSDAPVLFELVGGTHRAEVTAGLLWDGPDRVQESEEWIAKCHRETFGDWGYHWTIRDATGEFTGQPGQAMGAIGTRPTGMAGRADVGYWLGYPYWGQGIMTEALRELLRFGFDTLDYAKVEAEVFLSNPRGLRLVESVGMQREGVIRRAIRKRGEWIDEAIYGILVEDFSAE